VMPPSHRRGWAGAIIGYATHDGSTGTP
jgi:hypothetical protein